MKMRMDKRIISVILSLIMLLSIAVLFYSMNLKTPLYKDDYSYSYTFAYTENKFKIETFEQVIESQINHYKVMNGRAVAHTLAQSFLIFDKAVFNVINTAAFVGLILLIVYHACGKLIAKPFYIVVAFSVLFLLTPRFGESFLWLTASCTYLWGILLVLLYLVPFKNSYAGTIKLEITTKIVLMPFYFVLSVFAGNTSENIGAALIVMSIMYMLFTCIKFHRLPVFEIVGIFGNIVGFLLLIFAPGQQMRLGNSGGFGDFGDIIERFINITELYFEKFGILLIPILIIFAIGLIRHRKISNVTETLIYFVGMLVSVYSMTLSPYFPERVLSGPCILSAITIISLIEWAFGDISALPKVVLGLIISLLLIFVVTVTFSEAYSELSEIHTASLVRENVIRIQKNNGNSEIEVPSIYAASRYSPFDSYGDLNDDSDTWPNSALAMYYGVDKIIKQNISE